MVEQEKIDKVIEILVNRGLIEKQARLLMKAEILLDRNLVMLGV